ncbi:hypothetical protein GS946_10985 [Rhodococcus hoagii]|nr:hypothetical protein [Prescottella equi]
MNLKPTETSRRHIAASQADVPALLDEVERLQAAIKELEERERENALEDREANDRRDYFDSLEDGRD